MNLDVSSHVHRKKIELELEKILPLADRIDIASDSMFLKRERMRQVHYQLTHHRHPTNPPIPCTGYGFVHPSLTPYGLSLPRGLFLTHFGVSLPPSLPLASPSLPPSLGAVA